MGIDVAPFINPEDIIQRPGRAPGIFEEAPADSQEFRVWARTGRTVLAQHKIQNRVGIPVMGACVVRLWHWHCRPLRLRLNPHILDDQKPH